ncbi:MAG: sugar transferase [Hyphomicrobiaceae bacterium]|nr:sugar transferase [Hyphomicrobiaceae bacterium]
MLVPIFVIIMIAIRLEDWLTSNKGPIYFAAPSYSIGGKRFRRLKFRTMSHSNEGPVAVTSVGKFLRRTSLDELPGLLNVIKGEMTLVGKRHDYPDVKDEKMSEAGEHSRFPKDKPGLINDRMNDGANLIQHAHIGGTEFSHTLWSDVRAILNAYTRLPYK